jgi:pyruvate-formate lyase
MRGIEGVKLVNTSLRIEKLREHALQKDFSHGVLNGERELLWNRGWAQNYEASSNIVRRALAKGYMLRSFTPMIDDGELIVGKLCSRELTSEERAEVHGYGNRMTVNLQGQQGHMAVDYVKLLHVGIEGTKDQIKHLKDRLQLELPEDLQKNEFYEACLIVLDAVVDYADHYAAKAEKLAERCDNEIRKQELLEIARICKKVPRYSAESFYEALQSVHFLTFCLEGLYQFGRPDRYLIDYYRRDREKGILTKEFALELINCLCILLNEYIPRGLAVGFMVGGKDVSGRDVTNELTYLFIESIRCTRLIYPGIGLCYTEDTPDDLLMLACELLGKGLSHPAIFNDRVITEGLVQYGLPPSEACEYIHSTCVEITPIASSGVWVASPYHNLIQYLLDVIETGEAITNFEDFKQAYRTYLGDRIKEEVIQQNLLQMERYYHGGDPLVSCFVNDCLTRGKDIDQGGARYNWIMPSFVGLANLTDSFMVLKTLVFEEKKISIRDLYQLLQSNFEGQEDLRQEIINRVPKYGNDIDQVDCMAAEITRWIKEEVAKHCTYRGDRFIPSLFCWIMHEVFGANTGASPDGRLRGFPLGDGSGPAQGRETKGPTASILSSTKWDHSSFIGGIAVNIKFTSSIFQDKSLSNMAALIKTFMQRGGFEIQVNVIDRETLLKAKENPEEYRDLMVRIGGYSDYFTNLSVAMQEEVIYRTEHVI